MEEACRNGDIVLVKNLIEKSMGINYNYDIHEDSVYCACKYGKLDILKYLVSIHTPIYSSASWYASRYGHIEIIKYLISIYAPIERDSVSVASYHGYIEIVKYLVSNNVPISSRAIGDAVRNSYTKIVKYLVYKEAPCYENYELLNSIKKEVYSELSQVISEFIGPDISSIILTNFKIH